MKPVYIVRLGFLNLELEDEFNKWYDNAHLPDLLKVPCLISARRFMPLYGVRKYLAIYEFTDVDGMIKGKNSVEMANCRADTRARWGLYLDPSSERYWCKVYRVYRGFRILNLPTLFSTFEIPDEDAKRFVEDEFIGRLLSFQEVRGLVVYESIFREPENLPSKILLCQFKDVKRELIRGEVIKLLSLIDARGKSNLNFNYSFYDFRIAIVKRFKG